ncbi:hypothetical protein PG991_010713 [Apiospora marii]|uniref:Uncharacterized protein n=1 Tax=Apiospora marii TaxID=335849 RepID=A0ABR1RD70_9PEZI
MAVALPNIGRSVEAQRAVLPSFIVFPVHWWYGTARWPCLAQSEVFTGGRGRALRQECPIAQRIACGSPSAWLRQSLPTPSTVKRSRLRTALLLVCHFEMQETPHSPSERPRPPSRSPSPTSSAVASAESETTPRPSRENHPILTSRTVSQESQVLYSSPTRGRPGEYKPVAAEEASTSQVQRPKRSIELTTLFTDCVVIILPVALLVFVAFLWSLKDSQVSEKTYTSWNNAIKVVATALPIIYATVVGRLMSEATRWRLEHGASVGSLEQLMGSRTVGGTITTLFQFQSWNLLTLALLAIWALSPLGTQSLLQVSNLRTDLEWSDAKTTYFDNSAKSHLVQWARLESGMEERQNLKANLGAVARLYTTLVSTPESSKLSTMDLWGNVKIPYLHSADDDWKDVTRNLNSDGYSSLAGVPLGHISPDHNASFPLESTYIQLQCDLIKNKHIEPETGNMRSDMLVNASLDYASYGSSGFQHSVYQLPNGTWHGIPFPRQDTGGSATWSLGLNRFVDPLWFGGNKTNYTEFYPSPKGPHDGDLHRPNLFVNRGDIKAEPAGLFFRARCLSNQIHVPMYFTGQCSVSQAYVESRVNCTRKPNSQHSCAVTAQRPSRQPHAPKAITPLSFPTIFRWVSQELPITTGGDISYQSEPSLYYLADPSLKAMADAYLPIAFLTNVTKRDLEVRLGQLLNTYYQLTQMSLNIMGGTDGGFVVDPNITAPVQYNKSVLRFGISDAWAALCLASCVVMLVAGVLSVIIAHWARGPEILGYVSTVFRDSRHMELAEGSGQLTAVDLSKSMAKERIRYGALRNGDGDELCMGVGREEDTGGITGKRGQL